MNKVLLLALLFVLLGCDGYNFAHIFPLGEDVHNRSVRSSSYLGFECDVKNSEFESLKHSIVKTYCNWKRLEVGESFHSKGVAIDNQFYVECDANAVFAIRQDLSVDGRLPVMVYFPRFKKLLFFLAEDGML